MYLLPHMLQCNYLMFHVYRAQQVMCVIYVLGETLNWANGTSKPIPVASRFKLKQR
jgi:hypothetical protein